MAQTPEMRRCILISMVGVLLLFSGCTGRPDGIKPVSPFDINRYQGVWYEIMRLDHSFERGLTNVTATYILRDDGMVDVLNKGFDRKQCRWKEALGTASFQGKKTVASLSVTFFWPFAGGYHVFALDTEDYGHALVATGRADVMVDPLLNAWDCAPFVPILKEAGGHFVSFAGKTDIHAGNGLSVNAGLLSASLAITRPGS